MNLLPKKNGALWKVEVASRAAAFSGHHSFSKTEHDSDLKKLIRALVEAEIAGWSNKMINNASKRGAQSGVALRKKRLGY